MLFVTKRVILFIVCLALGAALRAGAWTMPDIDIPREQKHPSVACTPEELGRLRMAWKGTGAEHAVVAKQIDAAEKHLKGKVEFPPRGGQHNQWYQCDKCQIALKRVDDTHHRCPKCGKVYSGEPYDDVIFAKKHGRNLRNMEEAAWAYAITGDKRFARFAREILLGYAERYLKYPLHSASRNDSSWAQKAGAHINEQTLGEAYYMTMYVAPGYDLIHDSDVLSEADHYAIRERLILPMLACIGKNRSGKSNWQTWHNAAMITGGAVLGEEAWVRRAIQDTGNGFMDQMQVSVSADGMWYENSWGYHFYTLSAMMAIVECARRQGIDLWGHPSLKKMFTIGVQYTMPDGKLPRFGDDVNSKLGRGSRYMETAYHAYHDEAMAPYLSTEPTMLSILLGRDTSAPAKEAPPLKSVLFRSAGHAILRTPGDAGLAAVMTFGPYGGFHGHLDKLSFVFYGYGTELGVDPGRARSQAYRLPIHKNWYKPTLSHNAVLVDMQRQEGVEGKLDMFAASDRAAMVRATVEKAYPNAGQRRLLVLMPNYLLVFDELRARGDARFDWVYHNRGTRAVSADANQPGRAEPGYSGMEYVQNVRKGNTNDKAVRIVFENPKASVHLTMAPAPGRTAVLTGDGVGESVNDRVPMAMVTRNGRSVDFVAVLEPVKTGAKPTVTDVTYTGGDSQVIRVTHGKTTDAIGFHPDGRFQALIGKQVVLEAQ